MTTSRILVLPGAIAVSMLALVACKPLDQRTFDPTAGRVPVPYVPPAPPAKPAPAPFLQIVAGTPESIWRPAVDHAARLALARKPSVLFVVTAIAPPAGSATAQVDALSQLTQGEARAIAEAIVAAGAPGYQVELDARTDSKVPTARVRVDVR